MNKQAEFEKKVKKGEWGIKKTAQGVFVNAGNICVGQVTDCAAEEIVESHNNKLKQGAE